ncbi:Uncharacterised protein [Mycobacteroides abscessus subsp. massiliense]|uniref:hypothetical protein n=1 Tax=Mycobacteroides abscessus TaxID=36809 RepID=UPI0009A622AF|nr:hypothetical protein [Mycobacteroides abscessus]MBN7324381.1 hypothetical protein [Mycobacteroides abscessus subsp. massiliense]SKL15469.1 Uncharacterised protein [Mycobacteroides abscessus subsp. massiliense]SKM20864.1 Uncharacterised protein [Mycobacteroides abscessus subsp. massiliense]SKM76713.1 Uncharacterised protein [Mycobacteroides abscessus subsp. massiliense]SKN40537.1 Uncharacterised protein [Mycobacteroides abscessus subsp. abscessus]
MTSTAATTQAHTFEFNTAAFDRFVALDENRQFPSVSYVPGSDESFSATHWLRWILNKSGAITAADPHLQVSIRIDQGIYTVCVNDYRRPEGGFVESDVQAYMCPWEDNPEQAGAFDTAGESIARDNLINICAVANTIYQAYEADRMRSTVTKAAEHVRAALAQAHAHDRHIGPLGRLEAPQLTKVLADVSNELASVHDYLTQCLDVGAEETNR